MDLLGRKERRWRSPKEKEERSDKQVLRDKFFYFRLLDPHRLRRDDAPAHAPAGLRGPGVRAARGDEPSAGLAGRCRRAASSSTATARRWWRTSPQFSAGIVPADFPKDREAELSRQLEALLQVPAAEISRQGRREARQQRPVHARHHQGRHDAPTRRSLSEMRQSSLPGVQVIVTPVRHYTTGDLLSHILGYVGQVADDAVPGPGGEGLPDERPRRARPGVEITLRVGAARPARQPRTSKSTPPAGRSRRSTRTPRRPAPASSSPSISTSSDTSPISSSRA